MADGSPFRLEPKTLVQISQLNADSSHPYPSYDPSPSTAIQQFEVYPPDGLRMALYVSEE